MARLLLIAFLILIPTDLFAQSKSQLEKEKNKLEQEISKLNKELSKARKNTKMTTNQIAALSKKIKERTALINNINGQMNLLNIKILQTEDSITCMRTQVDCLKIEYGKMTRILYRERGNLNAQTLLFDNDAYNKTYLRRKYFEDYSRYRRYQAHNIELKEQQLQDMAFDLQKQRSEKHTLLLQEKQQKEALSKEQQQKQKSQAASKQQEKDLKQQLNRKEKQKKQLQQQIQRIINEEIAKANKAKNKGTSGKTNAVTSTPSATPAESHASTAEIALSSDFAGNKGRLAWPVNYTKVSREYGRYTHSSGGQNMNNGIDLLTASGATVYSVFKGTVSRVFTCPNGTKGVIIRHGEYMTVYANLGSVAVREGTEVSNHQSIGTVYIAEDNTSEFSFQLWKGTSSQNPRNWLR